MTREEQKLNAADEYMHKRIYEDGCGRTGDTFPAFIEGIEWADAHPNLTWEDIAIINNIVTEILKDCGNDVQYNTEQKFCEEVLKQYLESKKV